MIRFVSTFRLKPGFDPDESFQLWQDVHVPRVVSMLKHYGLKKYTVSRILSAPEAEPAYFGMAQIWFDNLDNAKKGTAHMLSQRQDEFTDRITDVRRIFLIEEKEMQL